MGTFNDDERSTSQNRPIELYMVTTSTEALPSARRGAFVLPAKTAYRSGCASASRRIVQRYSEGVQEGSVCQTEVRSRSSIGENSVNMLRSSSLTRSRS